MKNILISKGFLTQVDDEDYDLLISYKWQSFVKSNTIYVCNNKLGRMHRFLLNANAGEIVDHIDGNGLNNQKSNLRKCTFQENMRNKKTWGSINYTGVSFVKKNRNFPFRCRITVDKKTIHIGYFATSELAAIEYNKKAVIFFGEYAKLNTIK